MYMLKECHCFTPNADVTVALQMPASVGEGDGSVDLCVDLTGVPTGGLECDIVLTLSPMDGAKAGMSLSTSKFRITQVTVCK